LVCKTFNLYGIKPRGKKNDLFEYQEEDEERVEIIPYEQLFQAKKIPRCQTILANVDLP